MASKTKLRYFIEFLLGRIFLKTFSLFPHQWGVSIGKSLGRFLGALLKSRTKLAEENIKNAFPMESESKIKGWVHQCWENLGEAFFEFARLPGMSQDDYFKMVEVEGLSYLKESYKKKKGVIVYTSHFTNWELAPRFISYSGFPLGVIARRMKNPYVNDLITRIREKANIRVMMHKNAVRESIRWLRAGKVLGLLIDQRITAGGVTVPFFGRPVHTTTMPALLSLRLGSPIHPIQAWRDGAKVRIRVHPAMDTSGMTANEKDIVKLTSMMTVCIENWIRERPPLWLWIHNRWKL